jgi:hypothetical protein
VVFIIPATGTAAWSSSAAARCVGLMYTFE